MLVELTTTSDSAGLKLSLKLERQAYFVLPCPCLPQSILYENLICYKCSVYFVCLFVCFKILESPSNTLKVIHSLPILTGRKGGEGDRVLLRAGVGILLLSKYITKIGDSSSPPSPQTESTKTRTILLISWVLVFPLCSN